MTPTPADMWESRYAGADYLYGIEPNEFLVESAAALAPGRALCLADGEGRNGVYLSTLGHEVTSIDLTAAGMAKAAHLAEARGVELTTVVADLADYNLGENHWDLIVSIFAHTPPPTRQSVHRAIAGALVPGGHFILEAYTPDQIGRGTGGPPVAELTMTLDSLQEELTGLTFLSGQERVRSVVEGPGHTGDGAVVQVVATRV